MCPINFDAIPDKNPTGPVDAGTYKAKVVKAEMKQPKDVTKPQYMEVTFNITGMDGKSNTFVDKFFESDSSFVLFKLKRFVAAANIPLAGNVELRDIAKLIPNLEVVVVVGHTKTTFNGQERTEAQVDIFNSDCYYPISDWAQFCADAGVSADTPVDNAGTQAPVDTPDTPTSY